MNTKLILTLASLALSTAALASEPLVPLVQVERVNGRSGETEGCTLFDDGSVTLTREGEVYGAKHLKAAIKQDEVRAESFQKLVDAGHLQLSKKGEELAGKALYWPNREAIRSLLSSADKESPIYKKELKHLTRGVVKYVGYLSGEEVKFKYEWTEAQTQADGTSKAATFAEYRHGDNIAALIDIAVAACRAGLRKAAYVLSKK
jgi:hypothetical protein